MAALAVDVQCYAKSYLQEEEDRDDIDNEYFACFADAAALKRSSVLYCEVHEAANPPPIPVVWTKRWALFFFPKPEALYVDPLQCPREHAIAYFDSRHRDAPCPLGALAPGDVRTRFLRFACADNDLLTIF